MYKCVIILIKRFYVVMCLWSMRYVDDVKWGMKKKVKWGKKYNKDGFWIKSEFVI